MKPRHRFDAVKLGGLIFLTLCAGPLPAPAQSYTIDWSTIDGGGGTSTNGQYSLTGTIGQPDAGTMSGGGFTLHGGFWGVVAAVQTEGAPWLTVTRTVTNTMAVTWPLPDTGWKLHWTANLAGTNSVWTEIPPPYPTSGMNSLFNEPAPSGRKFFRLHKP